MKKIGLAQMNLEYGNFQRNVNTAEMMIHSAVQAKCDLILFPELWSSGFDLKNAAAYNSQNRSIMAHFQTISETSSIAIGGSFIEEINGGFFNSFNLIQPDQPRVTYQKSHLFSMMREDQFLREGRNIVVTNSPLGPAGLAVCFDLRFPEFFVEMTSHGAEVFLLCSHWPLSRVHHWNILLQARAIENQAFMIAVNSVGQSGKDMYGGSSAVIAPDGETIFKAPDNEENLFTVEIDPSMVRSVREKFVFRK